MAHLAICNTCGKINTVTYQCVFEAEIKSILELFIGNLDEIIETQGTFRSLERFSLCYLLDCAILSRQINFPVPILWSLKNWMHFSPVIMFSTTIWSSTPQEVVTAQSYFYSIVPRSPSLPYIPWRMPSFYALSKLVERLFLFLNSA